MMTASHVLLTVLALSAAGNVSAQPRSPPEDAPREALPAPPLVPTTPGDTASAREPGPSSSEALDPRASPRGELIPRDEANRRQGLGFLPRAGIGLLGGLGGALVGAGMGALAGHLLVQPTVGCDKEVCVGARMSGAILGALLGMPGGTALANNLLGGQGTFVTALNGTLVGVIPGVVGSLFVLGDGVQKQDAPYVAGLLMLPALGSTMGYLLSHSGVLAQTLRSPGGGAAPVLHPLLELMIGSANGALLGVTGFLGGVLAGGCSLADGCFTAGEDIALFGTAITGYTLGATLGVYWTGVALKGRGSFWAAFAGGALGAAAASAFAFGTDTDDGLLAVMAGPAIGAVIGFELSAAFAEPEPEPARPLRSMAGVQVVPVLTAAPSGGLLGGLAGRF